MPIKVLAPDVVSKIAAGEVVERPASVVKELIENSLDAGASQVAIEARGGGVNLIRVVDNGMGIAADEVELAFHRYATSKIEGMADLDSISSLGFRGEALPSIAAVAQVEVLTRTHDEVAGTYLELQNGAVVEKGKRGCPQGTRVTVRHLFRNVPARLKFLKSPATESGHISNLVSQYSLAFPEVRFTLIMDGRMALNTPGNGDLRDVLVKVYGLEAAQAMIQVGDQEKDQFPNVWGFVSPPSLARSSRSYLSFFVNCRWVQSRLLSRAVEDAYQGLLMAGKHPIAVLNISLPGQDVDINVHPTKSEVRFRYEPALFVAVQRTVRAALVEQMPVPLVRRQPGVPTLLPEEQPFAKREELPEPSLFTLAKPPLESPLPILRVLGQLSSSYIIAEGPDGLYLIDQHAAHERVLFEKVCAQRAKREVEVQGLLEPLTIEVAPRQEEMLKAGGEILATYGFAIEPFGQRTYLLRTVPALLKGERVAEALVEVLDSLGVEGDPKSWEEKVALSLACHSAVRAGQLLSAEEMRQLVRELELTELPRICPHGRPTMVRFTSSQLEREFGRG
ncbi:MAG: DNA mismatch repair endonuclease MutL [Dehalococcoidia bacterium]|nr:MAG: DNA mismatch repair endonuclease MutL [Dehalococcoidia bacterium]